MSGNQIEGEYEAKGNCHGKGILTGALKSFPCVSQRGGKKQDKKSCEAGKHGFKKTGEASAFLRNTKLFSWNKKRLEWGEGFTREGAWKTKGIQSRRRPKLKSGSPSYRKEAATIYRQTGTKAGKRGEKSRGAKDNRRYFTEMSILEDHILK